MTMTTKTACDNQQLQPDSQGQHIGESPGCADHDQFLLHEISRRLDALWHYDQFIADAKGRPELQTCWRDFKVQEVEIVARLKALTRERDPAGSLRMCGEGAAQ